MLNWLREKWTVKQTPCSGTTPNCHIISAATGKIIFKDNRNGRSLESATLMSAAPELYEAAENAYCDLLNILSSIDPEKKSLAWETIDQLQNALKKATSYHNEE
jgi:hypothetical protein